MNERHLHIFKHLTLINLNCQINIAKRKNICVRWHKKYLIYINRIIMSVANV